MKWRARKAISLLCDIRTSQDVISVCRPRRRGNGEMRKSSSKATNDSKFNLLLWRKLYGSLLDGLVFATFLAKGDLRLGGEGMRCRAL